jgi:5-methylcytosine-specific restriction endonuclease McrA
MGKRTPLACSESNCGENFYRCGKATTYGRYKCRCESCSEAKKTENLAYVERNREAVLERKRKYRAANLEKVREGQRRHYSQNRESILDYQRRYYADNREELLEYQRNYQAGNIEAKKEYDQQRYLANREAVLERVAEWVRQNPERSRQLKRSGKQRRRAKELGSLVIPFTSEQLAQRFAFYGDTCYLRIAGICTGAVDHVEHVKPVSKYGPTMLANLRPACQPCNQRKGDKWPFNFKEQRDPVPGGRQPQRP